jgi:hypothetical protein
MENQRSQGAWRSEHSSRINITLLSAKSVVVCKWSTIPPEFYLFGTIPGSQYTGRKIKQKPESFIFSSSVV